MATTNLLKSLRLLGSVLIATSFLTPLAVAAEPQAPRERGQLVGQLKPAELTYVTASVPGRVTKLHVAVGDVVKAGDVLAELDAARYKLKLNLAQARQEFARARVNELKARLGEKNSQQSPLMERIVAAQAEVRVAEARLKLAKHDLEATQLRAPCDGTVLARRAAVGQRVSPERGDDHAGRLLELADLSKLEAQANVPERLIETMQPGRHCRLKIAAVPNVVFQGRVVRVGPAVDSQTGSVPIRVQLEPSENSSLLLPGMSANLVFGDKQ